MQRNLEQILNLILHSSELLEDVMKQESDLKNLTSRQLYCIEMIKEMRNPTLTELAERMSIAKPSMTVMIDRLVNNQFISRVSSDNDRRVAHIHLTEKGETAAKLHAGLHSKIAELLTADMTQSEKEILIVLLNKSMNSLINRDKNKYFEYDS